MINAIAASITGCAQNRQDAATEHGRSASSNGKPFQSDNSMPAQARENLGRLVREQLQQLEGRERCAIRDFVGNRVRGDTDSSDDAATDDASSTDGSTGADSSSSGASEGTSATDTSTAVDDGVLSPDDAVAEPSALSQPSLLTLSQAQLDAIGSFFNEPFNPLNPGRIQTVFTGQVTDNDRNGELSVGDGVQLQHTAGAYSMVEDYLLSETNLTTITGSPV